MSGGMACTTAKKLSQPAMMATVTVDSTLAGTEDMRLFIEAERAKTVGDVKAAISYFSEYLKRNRNNATVYYELSRLFMELHNAQAALEFSRKALSLDSTNRWFHLAYADALAVTGQYEQAAQVFGKLHQQYPDDENFIYNQGVLLSKANKTVEAIAIFDSLEKKVGVVEDLIYLKQRLYLKQGDVNAAAREVSKLITQDSAELRYYAMLAEIYDANDLSEKAFQIYQLMLQKDPHNARALIALAQYYKKKGDQLQYRSYMTRAFVNPYYSVDEKIAYLQPYLQFLNADTIKLDEGLLLCRMMIAAHPKEARVYSIYGDMLAAVHQYEAALHQYLEALKLDDTRFPIWQQIMNIYLYRQQADSVLYFSKLAVQKFPQEFDGYYFLGTANILAKQYEKAVAPLQKALQIGHPEKTMRAQLYSLLGEAFYYTKNFAASDSNFERALQLVPDDHITLNNYSYYLSERGVELEKAARMSRASLELQPNSATYQDTYAWILYKMGRYQEARSWIEKAIHNNTDKSDPTLLEHYGDILFKLNEVENAVKYWQLAKEKGASSQWIDKKISERRLFEAAKY